MKPRLPEAYYQTLYKLKRFAAGAMDSSGLRDAIEDMDAWLGGYALPPSAIPALKEDLHYSLEHDADACVIHGLVCGLAREVFTVMRLYCNDEAESLPSLYDVSDVPEYDYTLVAICNENGDMASLWAQVREAGLDSLQLVIIGNGFMDIKLPDMAAGLAFSLPHALGYAQIFSLLPAVCKGRTILLSDNGVCPDRQTLSRMLHQAGSSDAYFYIAVPSGAVVCAPAATPYFDPCPSWEFQIFPRPMLLSAILPDSLISSMALVWQAFLEKLREGGICAAVFMGQMAFRGKSVFSAAKGTTPADRWRFLQIMGREPIQFSDPELVTRATAFFATCGDALIIAQCRTSMAQALERRAAILKAKVNWQLYDEGQEDIDNFTDRAAAVLQKERYSCIIFGVAANKLHRFEDMLRKAALALTPGGGLWYYDENLFYGEQIETTLADEMFADRPNKWQYTLFYRKRLRDLLFDYGLDSSLERYRPAMDVNTREKIDRLCALFPGKESAVSLNLSAKYYFCGAFKRIEPAE